jgi:Fe-Mn family superoxide dismutase
MAKESTLLVPNRRRFLASGLMIAAGGLAMPRLSFGQTAPGPLSQIKLPYEDNALAPVISSDTMGFHYGKHHLGYVNAGNALLANDDLKDKPIVDILRASAVNPNKAALFNNVGQTFNHNFYWQSMRPNGGGMPSGKIGDLIKSSFGDYDKFKQAFATATIGQFASGWGWLCLEGEKLTVRRTGNADTPLYVQGVKPLLTIDVWEHAYYLDYQNRRADYVNAVIDKLLNWEFAERNLAA